MNEANMARIFLDTLLKGYPGKESGLARPAAELDLVEVILHSGDEVEKGKLYFTHT